jgi:hypothetical protein
MTCQSRSVGHYDTIADMAIVSYMGICHKKISIPDGGFAIARDRSEVNRGEFPDYVSVADLQKGPFTLVFQILRDSPYRGKMEDLILFTDLGPPLNNGARPDFCAATDLDVTADYGIRAHLDIRVKLRPWIDYG